MVCTVLKCALSSLLTLLESKGTPTLYWGDESSRVAVAATILCCHTLLAMKCVSLCVTKGQTYFSSFSSHKLGPPCLLPSLAYRARVCNHSKFLSNVTTVHPGPSCPKWSISPRSCIPRISSGMDTRE